MVEIDSSGFFFIGRMGKPGMYFYPKQAKKGVFLQDKQIFCLAQRGKENAGARYAATESAWSLLAK
jgi:hypothetical protein